MVRRTTKPNDVTVTEEPETPQRVNTEVPTRLSRVICRTVGCENKDHEIDVYVAIVDGRVVCGVCNQEITDITPIIYGGNAS